MLVVYAIVSDSVVVILRLIARGIALELRPFITKIGRGIHHQKRKANVPGQKVKRAMRKANSLIMDRGAL